MTVIDRSPAASAGELLRRWRGHRRMSQMELALDAGISTRHLSFVETGRSQPSRDMILRLAEHLRLPLRERNALLLAGGFAPVYEETAMDAERMTAVRAAMRRVLAGYEPFPALVVDRWWDLVDANAGLGLLLDGVAPALRQAPANALRLALHPDGLAPRVINAGEWRAHLLGRLARQVAASADGRLAALLEELRAYPVANDGPAPALPERGDISVPLRLRHAGGELRFLSIVSTFGTPLDITVEELSIEAFLPADPQTAAALQR